MSAAYQGLPAAPGIGMGAIYLHRGRELELEYSTSTVISLARAPFNPQTEWERFLHAKKLVDQQLMEMGTSLNHVAADIFAMHRLILSDVTLTDSVRIAIHEEGRSAISATRRTILDMAQVFQELDDAYFAGRATDIIDIGRRLLTFLGAPIETGRLSELPPGSILLTEDLTPSEIATLPVAAVAGIALARSTPTAHTSILARSLGFPLVCGLGTAILEESRAQQAIVDGYSGQLILSPSPEQLARYQVQQIRDADRSAEAVRRAHEPAVTLDGLKMPVYINANTADDVAALGESGADGIGLLRTEYLFQNRNEPPTVDEQCAIYTAFARQTDNRLLTIRALDAGGDKPLEYLTHRDEYNPFLGVRGLRLLLSHPAILADQFRAVLLAAQTLAPEMEVRFMLPMVSTLTEMEQARKLLDQVRADAGTAQTGARVRIGPLIEVPSAALMAQQLAGMADFLSIGTNDLAQYVLASDRTNSRVAGMADALHPSVLQLVERTAHAAKNFYIPVSLCGELGGNAQAAPLLLGLGVSELSVPLPAAPLIKQAIRETDLFHAHQLAESALRCRSAEEVRTLLEG